MLDLAAHREREQDNEVDDENGPEHGNVKATEQGGEKRDQRTVETEIPEPELRKPTHKWPELVVLRLGRVAQSGLLFVATHVVVKIWVETWTQKPKEHVQHEDCQGVALNVPTLAENNAQEEHYNKAQFRQPALLDHGDRLVQVELVGLLSMLQMPLNLVRKAVRLIHL